MLPTAAFDAFRGLRVLVTGHTGFKGSWLCLWLEQLGARVHGLSLPADTEPSHHRLLAPAFAESLIDLRDAAAVGRVVRQARPELVLHLAAQPLVLRSYAEPLTTWQTNVMGTAHLLEACRALAGLRAILVVTSDKCYALHERDVPYRETDPLGGHDPYSASKGATEILTASYRSAYFSAPADALLASVRAGNVIGGGDWSANRLLPDVARAVAAGTSLAVRSPTAQRPWQHVLDALHGYLMLSAALLRGERDKACAWNFGPDLEDCRPVAEVLHETERLWPAFRWHHQPADSGHEARLLRLDNQQARTRLGWRPVWPLSRALGETVHWYRTWQEQRTVLTPAQLRQFQADAAAAGAIGAPVP
jgi:CDP-glucose 4,6-dehydratase